MSGYKKLKENGEENYKNEESVLTELENKKKDEKYKRLLCRCTVIAIILAVLFLLFLILFATKGCN